MSLATADRESAMFYVQITLGDLHVMKRGVVEANETDNQLNGVSSEGFRVCTANPDVPGAAQEIANALNFQPRALELLVAAAAELRDRVAVKATSYSMVELANEIEEFIVNG